MVWCLSCILDGDCETALAEALVRLSVPDGQATDDVHETILHCFLHENLLSTTTSYRTTFTIYYIDYSCSSSCRLYQDSLEDQCGDRDN